MFTKAGTHRMLRILACAVAVFFTQSAIASFHLWQIAEIYSNANGTVQYIELTTSASGQQFVSGHQVTASQNGVVRSFTIPFDLPSDSSNHKFLISTQGFANLGIVTPDYVVPDGFLFRPNGSVNFADVDLLTYSTLPSNGVSALDRAGNIVVNAPTNFAGATGSIGVPASSQTNIPTRQSGVTANLSVIGCTTVGSTVFIDATAAGKPARKGFPYGLLDFTLTGCVGSADVTVTYSQPIPAGATYYKEANGTYSTMAAIIGSNTVQFTLTDNGTGDADNTVGTIRDPSGLAFDLAAGVSSIPTLSEWGLIILSGLMVLLGVRKSRQRGMAAD